MNWSYGITTVPSRAKTLLPATITSLAEAGFGRPVLFVDGNGSIDINLPVVTHPNIGQLNNWITALHYLVITTKADRYALFEDDLVACRQLRQYLDKIPINRTYLNLITHEDNRVETKDIPGWHVSNLLGRGAVGLVFDRATALLLTRDEMLTTYPSNGGSKGDAAIARSLRSIGYKELVHFPSLVDHTGMESTIGHSYGKVSAFLGVDYDLLSIPINVPEIASTLCRLEPVGDYMVCKVCGSRVKILDPLLPIEKYKTKCKGIKNSECKFLGDPTGVFHKSGCNSAKRLPEYSCLHPLRQVTLKRANKSVPGKCTPNGQCHDHESGIQSCDKCRLKEVKICDGPTV
jgi:hypothetical protein